MKNDAGIQSRRDFLQRLTYAAGIGAFISACRSDPEDQMRPAAAGMFRSTEGASCTDVSGLTEAQIQTREAVKYVDKSPLSDKQCNNCRFFKKPAAGKLCGGCDAVPGPIHPQGYCISWVTA